MNGTSLRHFSAVSCLRERVRSPPSTSLPGTCPRAAAPGPGGGWFDVIPLPGLRVGLVVGTVVGHGIRAAAAACRLRMAVRTLADIELAPDEVLTRLDDIVSHAREGTRIAGEVSDGGDTSPHVRRAEPTDEGGRGLLLVAQLSERWGTRMTAVGKTVWAEQSIPPDQAL